MDKTKIQNLIQELIEKTMVKTTHITVTEDDKANIWFSVEVTEPHFFIARDGEALNALNHLVRRIVESEIPQNTTEERDTKNSFFIDINDFQKKRMEAARATAHMMSERARYFKSNIEIDPMSAFERRIIHEFLSDVPDLQTESVGFGPTRRVVIKYVGAL
jgi:spoIIIJ-associated protein